MRMPTEKRYKCDQCGTIGEWGDGWAWFGSLLLSEEAPSLIIHTCSDLCAEKMQARMDRGEVKQPIAKLRGYTVKIKGQRVGY